MKNIILAGVVTLTSILPIVSHGKATKSVKPSEDQVTYCMTMGKIGKLAVEARQKGIPERELIGALIEPDELDNAKAYYDSEFVIESAYSLPTVTKRLSMPQVSYEFQTAMYWWCLGGVDD